MDVDRPGTPVPAVEVSEPMETSKEEKEGASDVIGVVVVVWYLPNLIRLGWKASTYISLHS